MKLVISLLLLFISTSAWTQSRYVAVLMKRNGNQPEDVQKLENEHLRTIGNFSKSGLLANGGPFEGEGELLLLDLPSVKEATELMQTDPAFDLYTHEYFPLTLRYGEVCPPEEPYQMETYTLIRYQPTNQIASYKSNADYDMKTGHEGHIKKLISSGQVIMEGSFGGNDGGLLVYRKDALNKTVQRDPAILEGYLLAVQKTIWLNKGSFCNQ